MRHNWVMVSVLITRPQASAEFLAYELQLRGYAGIIEPLLSIVSTDMPQPDLSEIQALMITSANALTALEAGDYELDSLLSMPCFCVGPRTAEKASLFGFRKIYSSASDGTALAQLISQSLHNKKKAVLHITGRDTDSKAHDTLQSLGFAVQPWPIYQAVPTRQLSPHSVRLIQENKVGVVTVFSVRTAETLKAMLQKYKLEACCKELIAIGLSSAVTDTLSSLAWRKLITAPTPTEDAVLDCLTEALPLS